MRPVLRLRVAHLRGGGGHPGPKGRTYDIIESVDSISRDERDFH